MFTLKHYSTCIIYIKVKSKYHFENSQARQWLGRNFCQWAIFRFFQRFWNFLWANFLSFYTDFDGPFCKLIGLWGMAPCLPNHWQGCNNTCWHTSQKLRKVTLNTAKTPKLPKCKLPFLVNNFTIFMTFPINCHTSNPGTAWRITAVIFHKSRISIVLCSKDKLGLGGIDCSKCIA